VSGWLTMMEALSPTSIAGTLLWGVVAGIVTYVILGVLSTFFWKIAVPWYQSLVYRVSDLSGSWEQTWEREGATYRYVIATVGSAPRGHDYL
jgi:hypothetical protein